MAEITNDLHNNGKSRSKKHSTKMDMTPMVDLAFLLLTFFMLTTTFNKSKVISVNMPLEPKGTDTYWNHTVTVLVGADDQLKYYSGLLNPNDPSTIHHSSFANKGGIRSDLMSLNQKLIDKISVIEKDYSNGLINDSVYHAKIQQEMKQRNNNGLFVIIKSTDEASYESLVLLLDEMKICNIVNYAIVDITPEENKLMAVL